MDDLLTENHDCCSDDANDPYLSRTAMPLRGIYYPLGFPLELTTNSKDVMAAAEESWGVRSYKSPPDDPQPGEDVFDVYSLATGKGLNGVAYHDW